MCASSPPRISRSLTAVPQQLSRSRRNSQEFSPTRNTALSSNLATVPSAAAVQRALSAQRAIIPPSSVDVMLEGSRQDRPPPRAGLNPPAWPPSPRVKSPPPPTVGTRNAAARRATAAAAAENPSVPKPAENGQPMAHSTTSLRIPARAATNTTLETVTESHDQLSDPSPASISLAQSQELEPKGEPELRPDTWPVQEGDVSGDGGEPKRALTEGDIKTLRSAAATLTTRPHAALAKRSLTSLTAKPKPPEPPRTMTVETEPVTSVPPLLVGDRGNSVRDGNGSIRTKGSNETIRPKKDKKKNTRKAPSLHSGPPSSKADLFEAKVASAVEEADTSDSDETFVYESNPPDNRTHRHHSRTPSATSLAGQDQYGRSRHGIRGGSHAIGGKNKPNSPRNLTASNGGRPSRPNSPRLSAGRLSSSARTKPDSFEIYDDVADDERTPLMGSVRINRSRHGRRPHSSGLRTAEYFDDDDDGGGGVPPGWCAKWAGCMAVTLVVLIVGSAVTAFMLGLSQPLLDVRVRHLQNILASDQELMLDLHVDAINANLFVITVSELDVNLFAESAYVGTFDHPWQERPRQLRSGGRRGQDKSAAALGLAWPRLHLSHGFGAEPDAADDEPEGPSQKMLLGRILEFDSPLTFEPSPLGRAKSSSVGEIRLPQPGNKTEVGGSERWERVLQHPFDLIVRGVLRYQLPLSSKMRHGLAEEAVLLGLTALSLWSLTLIAFKPSLEQECAGRIPIELRATSSPFATHLGEHETSTLSRPSARCLDGDLICPRPPVSLTLATMSNVYRYDDSRTAVSSNRRDGGGGGTTTVKRYIVKEDDSRSSDRRSFVPERAGERVETTRIVRRERDVDEPVRDVVRREEPRLSSEQIVIRRDARDDDRRSSYYEPLARRDERSDDRDEIVIRRTKEVGDARPERDDLTVARLDYRDDYDVVSPSRSFNDRDLARYTRQTDYYAPAPPPPQTIIIKQDPIIIRERVRDDDYVTVRRSDVDDERTLVRRPRTPDPPLQEDYFYEKKVKERIDEPRGDDEWRQRQAMRREVSPNDSVSQVGRRGRRNSYSSDDSIVYVKRTKEEYVSDDDGSRRRQRSLAAGALAGVGAAEILRSHSKKRGKETSHGVGRLGRDVGAGALGVIAAEGISRARRSLSRVRDRARSESDDRDRDRRRHRSRARSRARSDTPSPRRRRSRSRSTSRSKLKTWGAARNPKHRNKRMAEAGAAGAAITALIDRARSKSRGGRERSKSRIRQAAPIVAAGLGTAALAGLYEKNKANKQAESMVQEEKRAARRASRSRSRQRSEYSDYPRENITSPMIEYGDGPMYGNNYGREYYPGADQYGRPAGQEPYYAAQTAVVPTTAPQMAYARVHDARDLSTERRSRSRSSSPEGHRQRDQYADPYDDTFNPAYGAATPPPATEAYGAEPQRAYYSQTSQFPPPPGPNPPQQPAQPAPGPTPYSAGYATAPQPQQAAPPSVPSAPDYGAYASGANLDSPTGSHMPPTERQLFPPPPPRAVSQPPPSSSRKSVQFAAKPEVQASDRSETASPEQSQARRHRERGYEAGDDTDSTADDQQRRARDRASDSRRTVDPDMDTGRDDDRKRRQHHRRRSHDPSASSSGAARTGAVATHLDRHRTISPTDSDATVDLPPRFDSKGNKKSDPEDPLADRIDDILQGKGTAGKLFGNLVDGIFGPDGRKKGRH
ncbi:hypothetical protein DV737_g1620, partial [Chaetothyriales sp. CBS 132003]